MASPIPRLAFAVSLSLLAAACGGGGGGGGGNPTDIAAGGVCTKDGVVAQTGSRFGGAEGLDRPGVREVEQREGSGGDGPGGGGGEGAGGGGDGAGGGDGQYINTKVVIRNRNQEVIAETVTDATNGMFNVDLKGCKDAIQVDLVGGGSAQYFDEVTGKYVPFPAGERRRVRLPALSKNFSITPFTEAAVRLMDAEKGGVDTPFSVAEINSANRRVGKAVADQLPALFRPKVDKTLDSFLDITRLAAAPNPARLSGAGGFTDTAFGHYGAALAGFARLAGTFGSAGGSATGQPAFRIGSKLADDLSDGKLDMQSPSGPIFAPGETALYTYETLWRAKSTAAGIVAAGNGDASLSTRAAATLVGEFNSRQSREYLATNRGDTATYGSQRSAQSVATQTARLFSDGRMTVSRYAASDFFGNWQQSNANPTPVRISAPDAASPGGVMRFSDLKVGPNAVVLGLSEDRRAFALVPRFDPYILNGSEPNGNSAASTAAQRGLLESHATVPRATSYRIASPGAGQGILNFQFAPEYRTYPGGAQPDLLFLTADGRLWGATAQSPANWFAVPQPEALQSVAYDKFVTPVTNDPAYANGPVPATTSMGQKGARRLFGLTRSGKVVVWLEGFAATGRRLEIPGTVVMLAGESVTNVYALNSEGDVYWINADQAVATTPSLAIQGQPAKRYRPHEVVKVDLAGQKACWVARAEAVLCEGGAIRVWKEQTNLLEFSATAGGALVDRIVVPNAIGASTQIPGTAYWRINAADGISMSVDGNIDFAAGATYLKTDGTALVAGSEQGKVSFRLSDVPASQYYRLGGDVGKIGKGVQLGTVRRALQSVFASGGALATPRTITSTASQDGQSHSMRVWVTGAGTSYQLNAEFDNNANPLRPPVRIDVAAAFGADRINQFVLTRLETGDPSPVTAVQNGGAMDGLVFESGALDGLYGAFDHRYGVFNKAANETNPSPYLRPINPAEPLESRSLTVSIILQGVPNDEFAFKVCFSYGAQRSTAPLAGYGGMICTLHENDGTFRTITGLHSYKLFTAVGQTDGVLRETDFQHKFYFP